MPTTHQYRFVARLATCTHVLVAKPSLTLSPWLFFVVLEVKANPLCMVHSIRNVCLIIWVKGLWCSSPVQLLSAHTQGYQWILRPHLCTYYNFLNLYITWTNFRIGYKCQTYRTLASPWTECWWEILSIGCSFAAVTLPSSGLSSWDLTCSSNCSYWIIREVWSECVCLRRREREDKDKFWRSKKVLDLKFTIHCCYWPPRSIWLVS